MQNGVMATFGRAIKNPALAGHSVNVYRLRSVSVVITLFFLQLESGQSVSEPPALRVASHWNGAVASAFAVQRYTYSGPGETLVLGASLDGYDDDPKLDGFETKVSLGVVFYQPSPLGFLSGRGTLDGEVGVPPLMQTDFSEASTLLQLDHSSTSSANGSVVVDAARGDEFYIRAFERLEARPVSLLAPALIAVYKNRDSYSGLIIRYLPMVGVSG